MTRKFKKIKFPQNFVFERGVPKRGGSAIWTKMRMKARKKKMRKKSVGRGVASVRRWIFPAG